MLAERTPQQKAEDDETQRLLRASHTRAKLTDAERVVSRGVILEAIARENITRMEAVRAAGRNRSADGGATLEMLAEEKTRLAHALQLQGKYTDAADVHPLLTRATELRKVQEAIERPESEKCNCAPDRILLNGVEQEVGCEFTVREIYSPRDRQMVALVGCKKCPDLNTRPLRK